jgi:hypothetical protein
MPASLAEATHEYTKDAIARLQAESDRAQAIIDRNKILIKVEESKLGKTVDKLIEEHPGTPSPASKSAAAAVKPESEKKSESKRDAELTKGAEPKKLKSKTGAHSNRTGTSTAPKRT